MERKIGETFEYEGKKLQVKKNEQVSCDGCFFDRKCYSSRQEVAGHCEAVNRGDNKEVIFVEVREQQQDEQPQEQTEQPQEQAEQQTEQPQKLNLCEILKYCPQGEMFWSPMLGNVKFYDIKQRAGKVRVEMENWEVYGINIDGTITICGITSKEIMLYPSREQRDWTKVKYEKMKLPKTWEEFCKNYPTGEAEYFFNTGCRVCETKSGAERQEEVDRNILPSKQAAEAHLALMQLHQLRDAWREGWLPDWKDETQKKYVIYNPEGRFTIGYFTITRRFLAFQDEKRAEEFLKCFRDLIEKAGDLI